MIELDGGGLNFGDAINALVYLNVVRITHLHQLRASGCWQIGELKAWVCLLHDGEVLADGQKAGAWTKAL